MSPIPNKNTAEADKFDWCISPDYGIITICGGQFSWIDSILQVCGDVICALILTKGYMTYSPNLFTCEGC